MDQSLEQIIRDKKISSRGGRRGARGGRRLRNDLTSPRRSGGIANKSPFKASGRRNELFSEFGQIKKSCIHFDRSGRSQGTAEVIFLRRESAIRAKKQYNGVPLDGRPMKIEIVGNPTPIQGLSGRVGMRSPQSPRGLNRGGRRSLRGKRGGGRFAGARRQKKEPVSKEQLDMDLQTYKNQVKPIFLIFRNKIHTHPAALL